YELLSGALPWPGDDLVAVLAHTLSAPTPPLRSQVPDLAVEVEAALVRALEKRPADRFATIDEAADAIEPFAAAPAQRTSVRPDRADVPMLAAPSNVGTTRAPVSRDLPTVRPRKRTVLWLVLPLALVIPLLVLVVVVVKQHHRAVADRREVSVP